MKEEVISKNKNSKKIILIVILLALIIASGISALLLTDNQDKVKDNEKEKIKETSKEEITQFIIKEEGSLFVANDNYFKDGSKELLTNKVHELTEGVTYKEKYYYIDNEDNLIVYDFNEKNSKEYNFEGVKLHANTLILPGEEYTIITEAENFVRIDMKNNTSKKLNISSNNMYILYDDSENIIYYLTDYILNKYDVKNENKIGTINSKGGPVLCDDEYIYIDLFDENGIEKYNKKTEEITKLNLTDYWPGTQTIGTIIKKDDILYLLLGNQDKLIKYENGQETIVLEDVYMNIISIGKNIYIKGSFMDDSTAEYYIYDTASSELTTTKNEYVKKILNSIY